MRFQTILLLQLLFILCGAEVVTSCLRCFTLPVERDTICNYAASLHIMEAPDCLQRLHRGFDPMDNITIAFAYKHQIKTHLKTFMDEVKKIDTFLVPEEWMERFERLMAESVKSVKDLAARHPAEKCSPPCGLQKSSRMFSCNRCMVEDCDLPIACPLEEREIPEYKKISIPCLLPFQPPNRENIQVSWKFAKHLYTSDVSNFKDIKNKAQWYHLFDPVRESDEGTYLCEVKDEDDDIILERFYYLKVDQTNAGDDSALPELIRRVLNESPAKITKEAKKDITHGPSTMDNIMAALQSKISYAIYAAIATFSITLTVYFLTKYALSVDWQNHPHQYHPLSEVTSQ